MNEELFVKLMCGVITIVVALFTYVLIPYIKKKMNANTLDQVKKYTEWAVRYAEQMYTTEEWNEKKEYVLQYITGLVSSELKLNLTEEDINVLIEATVNAVKGNKNGNNE